MTLNTEALVCDALRQLQTQPRLLRNLKPTPEAPKKRWGVLFRWGSLWMGAHWSKNNRRLCVNLIPCVTVWIIAKNGVAP